MDDVIEDDTELNRILETTKFNEFEVVNSPLEELDLSSQELLGVIACTLGLPPQKGSNGELRVGVDPCQGSSLSFPNRVRNLCTLGSRGPFFFVINLYSAMLHQSMKTTRLCRVWLGVVHGKYCW